ncbi:MMPL family transporter [Streptomyces sp. CMB-StM0423]|uniref:MMPL family transporter n=1 Tax=Streptomyces sp. CMB-StM0423 TaxID=2059884 RepID=UPI000C7089EA|nr:MMPL family transporter [Streptomyces sp. CMB-StM0423]AUH42909.1 transporter [Streptomyces sp. CMB-StM0423]
MAEGTNGGTAEVSRWTRIVTARPRLSLLLALVFTALAVFAGSGVADRMSGGGWQDPASESAYAADALDEQFPGARPNLLLLVDSGRPDGVDDPAVAAEAERLAARLAAVDSVEGVTSYWAAAQAAGQAEAGPAEGAEGAGEARGAAAAAAGLRSEDGSEALIAARITGDETRNSEVFDELAPDFRGEHGPVEVRLGGQAAIYDELQGTIQEDLLRAEIIALPVTLLLLIVVFGSAVAALLPLAVGIIAILGTNAVLRGITEFADVSVFAQNLTTALGLGLAIDYALFIVRRYREELAAGADPLGAVGTTLRTAGRTVLFSALTVAVSLSAMLLFPQYFLRSFAYAGIAVVLLAAVAALTVLPAALVLLGPRVNAWRILPKRGGETPGGAESGRGWARLAKVVMRRAPVFAVLTTGGLMLLGLPFLGVQFGTADDRQLPGSAESHVVQEHIRDGFPGTPGGTIEIYVEGDPAAADIAAYQERIAALDGVERVDGSAMNAGAGYLTVTAEGEAVEASSQDLVRDIRDLGPPFEASVAGSAADLVDAKDSIQSVLPWAALMIVLATLILLFLLTGSVLIPFVAVVLNALSLTAMFGAIVWVFQDGNLSGLLNFTATGDIETTLPVLMFCVAFGLSMDYGVFLLSRIKEEYDRTGDRDGAVVFGLRRTGGLITAAAVILAVVMFAIGTSRVTNTKMLGIGLALAVLMDAMVVRGLLVPAVLKLTGAATWWAPGPLRRFHERVERSGFGEGGPRATGQEQERPTDKSDDLTPVGGR